MEPREVTIDSTLYELRSWDAVDGEQWAVKLVLLLGKSAGAFESDGVAIAKVIALLDEATVLSFWATCRKYTVRHGEMDGQPTEWLLSRKPLAAVSTFHMFKLMSEHAEGQYGDFFARLPELLGLSPKAAAESKSPPG